jgi:hypothetical protein
VQVQYLWLGSWRFQRAKYFQGQSSRSWWNWSAISRLVGEIETRTFQYLCLGSRGFQRAIHFQGEMRNGWNGNSASGEASEFAPRTPDTSSLRVFFPMYEYVCYWQYLKCNIESQQFSGAYFASMIFVVEIIFQTGWDFVWFYDWNKK